MSRIKFDHIQPSLKSAAEKTPQAAIFETAEKIKINNHYRKADLDTVGHLGFVSGIAPNLRGPYSTMYTIRPWTVRQYAGFSTAEE